MSSPQYGVSPKRKDESSAEFVARCKAYIAEILAKMAQPKVGQQRDWARRILNRYVDGEELPDVSLRFACEALGIEGHAVTATIQAARAMEVGR